VPVQRVCSAGTVGGAGSLMAVIVLALYAETFFAAQVFLLGWCGR
jgi:hypothetical protein